MKVLFITSSRGLYGANRSLISMIKGIQSIGYEAIVIVQAKCLFSEELHLNKISFIEIPFHNEIGGGFIGCIKGIFKFLINWKLVFQFSKQIKELKFDLIHSNSSVTFIGAYISVFLKIPHIWHIREFLWEDYNTKYCFGKKYFNYWLNRSTGCICISKAIHESRLNNIRNPIKRIIYNGIIYETDVLNASSLKTNINNKNEEFIISIVGSIMEGKNQLDAVKAFNCIHQKFPNLKLHIVGEGNLEYINQIKEYIYLNKLNEKVIFKGLVYQIMDYYRMVNLLLMCSKNEGLGRVTVEAMANGVPVIGFNSGGTAEIISSGVNGLLYGGDYKELSNKISQIITDQELRFNLSKNALETVKTKFLVENYTNQLNSFYNEILS